MTSLPLGLKALYLSDNALQGELALEALPPQLEVLDLTKNKFQGELRLGKLPWALQMLWLRGNFLRTPSRGVVDFMYLPENMRSLDVSYNQLSGCADLRRLPVKCKINLSHNFFSKFLPLHFESSNVRLDYQLPRIFRCDLFS